MKLTKKLILGGVVFISTPLVATVVSCSSSSETTYGEFTLDFTQGNPLPTNKAEFDKELEKVNNQISTDKEKYKIKKFKCEVISGKFMVGSKQNQSDNGKEKKQGDSWIVEQAFESGSSRNQLDIKSCLESGKIKVTFIDKYLTNN